MSTAAPYNVQPTRRLNIEDALAYLDQVKSQFQREPHVYNNFLEIMKDFNTQKIDTPGVIERVSSLFRGHPSLVEGFNTFLPPGFSIACSSDPNDPNPVKVTTPNGTLTSSGHDSASLVSRSPYSASTSISTGAKSSLSSLAPNLGAGAYGKYSYAPAQPAEQKFIPQVQMQMQMQMQIQNPSEITRQMHEQHQQQQQEQQQQQQQQQQLGEPITVEMDDAIGYVNKIKTRFTNEPHIYKSFLDLLQTYRKEQIPISEVYQQVSILFASAPDLLADFKKFLPDSEALENGQMTHAQIPAQYTAYHVPQGSSSVPNNALPVSGMMSGAHLPLQRPVNGSSVSENVKLPPYGNFQASGKPLPKPMNDYVVHDSSERDTIRKSKEIIPRHEEFERQPQVQTHISDLEKKRTLQEELAFFEKVKKHINKVQYTNFVKILNLFVVGVLDKKLLVERVESFIGDSEELFAWFKKYIQYKGTPYNIEDIKFKKHRLELGLCKRQGVSYRQLPKAETAMPCSGRDEMCWEVLNDEWVSHPTWDSEESGYIAHRKNQYEDTLFRIEEDRHEYDFHMGNNVRAIQTLETILRKLQSMSPEERKKFKLTDGLGHTSRTIYKKVIRKLYGSNEGFKVIDALHKNPAVALPIVLKRMKQKDEEWKKSHADWCKIWREQELKSFYKSLDHIGLTFKQTDKKLLTTKQLISELSSVTVEQTNKRAIPLAPKPQEVLQYQFTDYDIFVDISRLVVNWINISQYSHGDKYKLSDFFAMFLKCFFNLPREVVKKLYRFSGVPNDEDIINNSPKKLKRTAADMDAMMSLKDVLRRNKKHKKDETKDALGSPNTVENGLEEEDEDDFSKEFMKAGELWIQTMSSKDNGVYMSEPDEMILKQKNSYRRPIYNLFGNTSIYTFFRYFQVLYYRFHELKRMNAEISHELKNRADVPFAKDLGLLSHQMEEMGLNITHEDPYRQVLDMSQRLINGEIENSWFEESLRQAYRNRAFKLITVDKVIQGFVKHMHSITNDARTSEIMLLFEQDRESSVTTTKQQIIYRMKVRALMNPEENMFRLEYHEPLNSVHIHFVAVDDLTLKDKRNAEESYNYYLTSYLMSHPTEGVPISMVNVPFMKSSINEEMSENVDGYTESNLQINVSRDDYKLSFPPNSHDEYTRLSVFNSSAERYAKEQKSGKTGSYFEEKVLNGEFGWKNGLEDGEIKAGEEKFLSILKGKSE